MTIPRGPGDVTAQWLGGVLGADVLDVEVKPTGTGQTGATYRLAATYSASTAELPGTFAVKLSAQDDAVRRRVALGYRSEVEYYARVADRMRIPVPGCFHHEISDDGADFVLLLADMAPAVQGDQIAGCTPPEAALAVDALAGLHGPSWCDEEWLALTAIAMPTPGDDDAAKGLGDISVMAAGILIDELGASMSIGLPARDLAYFTATSLEPGVRAEIERDLVGRYHRALSGYGVADYDLETC